MFQMKVTGKNLLNTCKLLFNISRTEANDVLFSEEQVLCPLVELLRETDPLVDMDTMVYGMGTIKMLSGNKGLCEILVGTGVCSLFTGVLQRCSEVREEKGGREWERGERRGGKSGRGSEEGREK